MFYMYLIFYLFIVLVFPLVVKGKRKKNTIKYIIEFITITRALPCFY